MTLRSWIRNVFARPVTRTIRKAPPRARLAVEALEDRTAPAIFMVTNTADSGTGSLRAQVGLALSNPGDDTVTFDPTVFGTTPRTITLTSGQINLTTIATAASVTGTLTIPGPGANLLSINGNNTSRVFFVYGDSFQREGRTANLSGLTITGGRADSGPEGAENDGGGLKVSAFGGATLTNCTVSGNSASYLGGGLSCSGNGSITLTNCTVSGNSAAFGGGLGGIFSAGPATLTLTNCTVSGNHAANAGGGLNCGGLFNDSTATLTNCTVSGNHAAERGGAMYTNHATVTLTNCTVSGNSVTQTINGGLLFSSGPATLTNTIVAGNTGIIGNSPFSDVAGNLTPASSNNLIGGNPLLAPLGDYGGPDADNGFTTRQPRHQRGQ